MREKAKVFDFNETETHREMQIQELDFVEIHCSDFQNELQSVIYFVSF